MTASYSIAPCSERMKFVKYREPCFCGTVRLINLREHIELSLGCPGIPGASMVCLCVVLANLGVPIESIGLIMGINPFLQMANTISNTTGDIAASLIVARSEGLLDLEIYNSK